MGNWDVLLEIVKNKNVDAFDTLLKRNPGDKFLPGIDQPDYIERYFIEIFKTHNGQALGTSGGIFMDYAIYSLEEYLPGFIRSFSTPIFADPLTDTPESPLKSIKSQIVSNKWLTFASDKAGSYLALDYDPGETGSMGQVIAYGYDTLPRYVLAINFAEFVRRSIIILSEKDTAILRDGTGFTWEIGDNPNPEYLPKYFYERFNK